MNAPIHQCQSSQDTNEGVENYVKMTYDESSYPANAESESEESAEEQLVAEDVECSSTVLKSTVPLIQPRSREKNEVEGIEMEEHSRLPLSEDVLCAVCAEIFVEPCTLHCGHSFCQLCLAALWNSNRTKSPLQLCCPVCRQPWVNFPGVNIQLRNIIEKSHGEIVDCRRSNFTESDKTILTRFKDVVSGDWKKERQQTRQQQLRPVVWVILLAAVLFCGMIIVIAATLFSMLVFSDGINEYVQKPVSEWNNDDVMAWLGGLGDWASHNISRIFAKEKITGAQLKIINELTLRNLGIHSDSFKTQSLLLAIEQLKQNDYMYPRNFHEFMAAHRKKTVLIGVMYKFWPRFTFLYVYLFDYRDVFLPVWQYSAAAHQVEVAESGEAVDLTTQQTIVFGIELILVPHYVVGLFAWQWFSLHPWLCTAVMIHCVWAMQSEAKKIFSYGLSRINWKIKMSQTSRSLVKNVLKFIAVVSGGLVLWPIVPYFLCDGLFYLVLWNTVYTHLLVVPWKLLAARRRRHQRVVNLAHVQAQQGQGALP